MRVPRLPLLALLLCAAGAGSASAQHHHHSHHRSRRGRTRHTSTPDKAQTTPPSAGAGDESGAGTDAPSAAGDAPAAGGTEAPAGSAATPPSTPPAAPAAAASGSGDAATGTGETTTGIGTGTATGSSEQADTSSLDIDTLRKEYLSLQGELFRSRARAAAVASAMYSSRLRIQLDYGTGRFYTVTRATVRLDGANVYDDSQGTVAQDHAPRFEGYVAPGRHVVAVRLEATGKDDQRFTTTTESSFVVEAPAGQELTIACKASDDGDIAYAWQRKSKGSYRLHLDVNVDAHKMEAHAGGK